MRTLTIATRQSPLALWQAEHIAAQLRQHAPHCEIRLLPLTTSGDKASQRQWTNSMNKGLFVKELEEALLSHRADLAVHSMKDLPATLPEGLILATICPREDPFDALVSLQSYQTLADLPLNAKVGTASLRRQTQLRMHRSDLHITPLRGNIQTRLNALHAGQFDAIILAMAGLKRLHLTECVRTSLAPPLFIPACGQGALGLECRASDHALRAWLQPLHCPVTTLCVTTEREANRQLGGHCHAPIAIYCTQPTQHQLQLHIRVLSETSSTVLEICDSDSPVNALPLVTRCVNDLFQRGAKTLLEPSI